MASSILIVQQGDQYAIPFPVSLGGETVTLDNADGVRIQIGTTLEIFPGGNLSFDSDRQAWLFPVTQELSRSWAVAKQPCQVGVLRNGEIHYSPTFWLEVGGNIITEVWTDE